MALYQGSISLAKVKDGEPGGPGTHGVNTATVYLYRRSADVPTAMPIGSLTYDFKSGTISAGPDSSLNGWTQNINELDEDDSSSSVSTDENSYLASSGAWVEDGTLVIEDSHILSGPDPLYFIAAVASSTGNTDSIADTAWQGPTLMSQDGADGKSGMDGFNQATISLYQRASNMPSVPSGELTYIFDSGELNGNLGNWSRTISDNTSGYPCYVTTAAAISRESQDTIVSEDWSEPVIMVEDGADGASGTSYYTYIRYSSKATPTSASDVSELPDGKDYFGVQTTTSSTAPAWNDSNWHWTKYIGDEGVSVTGARELYWLKVNTNPSQINTSTTIYDTDRQDSWTSVVPSYVANGKYYTCMETSLSNNTKHWSPPIESKGLTDANENALEAISISRATKQYFWNLTQTEGSTVAGSYITEVSEESFKSNRAAAGGYFLATSTGLELGKGSNKYTTLDTSLKFYGSNQTYPLMMLSGTNLTFYKIVNNVSSEAAILSSNGLAIKDGFLQLGGTDSSSTASGNITLSNVNFSRSINGTLRNDLRLAIGGNFGVKNDGTLYASNAVISGTITVGSGSNVYTKTETDQQTTNAAKTATNYITNIDSNNGITIKPINTEGNDYLQINSSAINFYRNNVEMLRMEDGNIRVGKLGTNLRNVYITNSAVQIRNNTTVLAEYGDTIKLNNPSGTTVATINGDGINMTAGSITLGTTFTVTKAGALTATSGSIGGWTLSANDFWKKTDGDNNGSKYFCINANNVGSTNYVLAAATRESSAWSYKFYVNGNGKLCASDADINGIITATSFTAKDGSTTTATFGSSIALGSNGATVTIGQVAANKYNAYITTSNFQIRKNTTAIATFGSSIDLGSNGATVTIGKTSNSHIVINTSSLQMKTNTTAIATFQAQHTTIAAHGDTWTTIQSDGSIGFFAGGRSIDDSNGPSFSIVRDLDGVLQYFCFNKSTVPYPMIVASSTNANISLSNNTITKIPMNTREFYGLESDSNEIFQITSGNIEQVYFDDCYIRVSGSVYVTTSSEALVNVFVYRVNDSGTPDEVAAGNTIIKSSGVVQLTPRLSSYSGHQGDYYYLAVRVVGTTGTAICNHRDTQLCIEMLGWA